MVTLSGPTHAEEAARDIPKMIVSACDDSEVDQKAQDIFRILVSGFIRIQILKVWDYAVRKKVVALAVRIATGLGYGDNTKAAIITRGISGITRLSKAMGRYEQTFME